MRLSPARRGGDAVEGFASAATFPADVTGSQALSAALNEAAAHSGATDGIPFRILVSQPAIEPVPVAGTAI